MAVFVYLCAIAYHYATKKNTRIGEEYGSARWENPKTVNAKYKPRRKEKDNYVIISQNMTMSFDGRKHRRNLHTLIIGGSGAGKSMFYARPNIMLCNSSFVVTDPKGELLRSTGHLLEKEGYVIKVFNLMEMHKSSQYNPFTYIRTDSDALRLINNLIKNTTPKGSNNSDPFWEKAETALLSDLMLYLLHEAPGNEQNFPTLMYLLENTGASEDSEEYVSAVDIIFEELEEEDPSHIAVRQYKVFKQAAGKTAKSILVSAAVRLAAFTLPELINITSHDELELEKMGERKQALFFVIPDNDNTFNYIVGMAYTQIYQTLYYQADYVHQGPLPVPVRIIADEFANVAVPEDFEQIHSTMRRCYLHQYHYPRLDTTQNFI